MQASMQASFLSAIWAEGGACSCVNRLPSNPKTASKPCKLPFMLACRLEDRPVYTLLFVKSLTPVFGGGGGGGLYSLVLRCVSVPVE